MPNRHFLVKFWKCQKRLSILPHEAKALFCLPYLVQGKIAPVFILPHEANYMISYIGRSGLDRTDDFQKFYGEYWIGFNFIGSGLDSDGKICQSAHLCRTPLN